MNTIFDTQFFLQPTLVVAEQLLGAWLVRQRNTISERYMITEVEAYDGPEDQASHAYRGKTKRNMPMFGPPGVWYVYFIYGVHWMLNIVTGEPGYPAAVLIRGVRSERGENIQGPARITKALQIGKDMNGLPATKFSGLWLEESNVVIPKNQIRQGPRIGVDYAGEWSNKPYRFWIYD